MSTKNDYRTKISDYFFFLTQNEDPVELYYILWLEYKDCYIE